MRRVAANAADARCGSRADGSVTRFARRQQRERTVFPARLTGTVTSRAFHPSCPGGGNVQSAVNGVELFGGRTICVGFRQTLGFPQRGAETGPLPRAIDHRIALRPGVRSAKHMAGSMALLHGRRTGVAIETDSVAQQSSACLCPTVIGM